MNLLHIDSSASGSQSVSREITAAIVASWRDAIPGIEVHYRDLDAHPLPHLTRLSLAGKDVEESADTKAALQQFLDADVIVVGAPMYNFAIPSTLKAWIDRITVSGITFRYTASGPEGLMSQKRVIVASSRGGFHTDAPSDFQEPFLRFLFGFLGIDDVTFVRAEGVSMSPAHRDDAIREALGGIGQTLPQAAQPAFEGFKN